MRSYQAARSLFSLLAFFSWCVIIAGGLIALVGADTLGAPKGYGMGARGLTSFMGTLPGLFVSFLGLLGLASVQNGRATVDSAEYGQQMLQVARDQLEVSKQALEKSSGLDQSFAALAGEKEPEQKPSAYASSAANAEHSNKIAGNSNNTQPASLAPPQNSPEEEELYTYKGKTIRLSKGAYKYSGIPFDSLEKAHNYIDRFSGVT
ncbi:hypothetical protein [Leisingera sp. ANG59]|uniref:hypothetical protein n=1 Tax=Leisingera sp. ANG59 TaxID=2675221 RepID=UPI001573A78E|nr:hypothetical protein [Leisingera sp. ANG59]NSY37532.1 hypothetical protein [Leisingera sp. ANG59]